MRLILGVGYINIEAVKTPSKSENYVPALGYAPFTRYYDVVVGLTTREKIFKRALIAQAEIESGAEVLDVACGTGTLAIWLKARHPEASVTGIDGDPSILKIARIKTDKAGVAIHFDQGLSSDMPYSNDKFDAVVSSLFFHHLSREMKERTASEIHRVVKPGGMVHIADWGKPDNLLMGLLYYGIQLLDGFANTNDNRQGLLLQIIENAGFEDVQLRQSFSTMFGTMALYSGRKRR